MSRAVLLTPPKGGWECPSCGHQEASRPGERVPGPGHSTTKVHACPRLGGLGVPLVWVTVNAGMRRGMVRHVAVERDDYVGAERGMVRDDRGRVISAVRTERADGSNDVRVHAPTAVHRGRDPRTRAAFERLTRSRGRR